MRAHVQTWSPTVPRAVLCPAFSGGEVVVSPFASLPFLSLTWCSASRLGTQGTKLHLVWKGRDLGASKTRRNSAEDEFP